MGSKMENWEDLFHVTTHYHHLCLSFLSFMLDFILLVPPITPTNSCLSASLSSVFCFSFLLSIWTLCRLSGQSEEHATEYSIRTFPWEKGQTFALMINRRKKTQALFLTFNRCYCNAQCFNIHKISAGFCQLHAPQQTQMMNHFFEKGPFHTFFYNFTLNA